MKTVGGYIVYSYYVLYNYIKIISKFAKNAKSV